MRRTLDPERTREQVLAAAKRLFAEKGYNATSINDIADVARVTKSLVLYHFGSKEALWQAAFTSSAAPILQLFHRYLEGDPSLRAKDMLRHRFRFLQEHPEIGRMLAWISLEAAPLPEQLVRLLPRIAAKAMSEIGESPLGIEPTMLTAIVLGAMDGWFRHRSLYAKVGDMPADEAADDLFLEALMKLLPE
ncbi:MAG TPA: TetR family transcriptional regulator [Fimbriimonas sp.]